MRQAPRWLHRTALLALNGGLCAQPVEPAPTPLRAPLALEIGIAPPLLAVADRKPDDAQLSAALATFRADAFDAREWARIAKDAGAAELCVIAKGADGFALFRSARTDFDVLNTAHERDILRDVLRACQEEQMALGVSYALDDAYHGTRADYPQFAAEQLGELATGYGPLASFCLHGGRRAHEVATSPAWRDLAGRLEPATPRLLRGAAAPGWLHSASADAKTAAAELCLDWPLSAQPADVSRAVTALFLARSRGVRLRLGVTATRSGSLPGSTVGALARLGKWVREHREVLAAPARTDLPMPAVGSGQRAWVLVGQGTAVLEFPTVRPAAARWFGGPELPLQRDPNRAIVHAAPWGDATLPRVVELDAVARPGGG